jgi:hypothetical protein
MTDKKFTSGQLGRKKLNKQLKMRDNMYMAEPENNINWANYVK